MHCKEGQKPKVRYKFGSDTEKTFESPNSPINVVVKSSTVVGATPNYSKDGYLLTVRWGFSPFIGKWVERSIPCKDYKIIPATPEEENFFKAPYVLYVMTCGSNTFSRDRGIYPGYEKIDYSQKCPNPDNSNRCSIEIFHQSQLIFKDQGDCPINYSVQCGKCKEGEIECPTSHPPGYCCIPCKETAQKIQNLANKIVTL